MAYTLRIITKENRLVLRQVKKSINIQARAKRGLKGETGAKGDKGDKGDQGEQGLPGTDGVDGIVQSIVAGTNVTVDSTDPANPIISAAGGGGGGSVDSVNGQTGVVVLDSDDIIDTATNRYTNDSDIARLANTSGTNTGDQDLSGYATDSDLSSGLATKANESDLTAHITNTSNPHSVTKAQVGLGNVDNTSDANKPISTATQTALDAKVSRNSDAYTKVYGTDSSGAPAVHSLQTTADNWSVAQRDGGGRLEVSTPTSASHATTKTYVDEAVGYTAVDVYLTATGLTTSYFTARKYPDGRIMLYGKVTNGTGSNITSGTTIAQMPTGYIPSSAVRASAAIWNNGSTAGVISISEAGVVAVYFPFNTSQLLSFNGISYIV